MHLHIYKRIEDDYLTDGQAMTIQKDNATFIYTTSTYRLSINSGFRFTRF